MEAQQRFDERKQRFVTSKRWMQISGRHIIRQQGIRIEIDSKQGEYRIQLDQYPGKLVLDSLEAAKSHAFNIIEDGSAKIFLTRRRAR